MHCALALARKTPMLIFGWRTAKASLDHWEYFDDFRAALLFQLSNPEGLFFIRWLPLLKLEKLFCSLLLDLPIGMTS